jgi:hypothetical protein
MPHILKKISTAIGKTDFYFLTYNDDKRVQWRIWEK